MSPRVVDPLLIAAPLALVPGMGALWLMLRRYEGLFQEKLVFFTLVVGLFAGIVAAFFELVLFRFQSPGPGAAFTPGQSFVWSVFGYALFETGIKVIVLGLQRFRGKRDAPFYGLPLGLAMGTAMAVQMLGLQLTLERGAQVPLLGTATMALVPVAAILVHGASGVWVARGSAEGSLTRGWLAGMGLQTPVLAAVWLWWRALSAGYGGAAYAGLGALVYGVGLLWFTRRRVLDRVVPREIQDQVRRDRRRAARAAGRVHGEDVQDPPVRP